MGFRIFKVKSILKSNYYKKGKGANIREYCSAIPTATGTAIPWPPATDFDGVRLLNPQRKGVFYKQKGRGGGHYGPPVYLGS